MEALRLGVLHELRVVFDQFIRAIPESPARSVVIRKLHEVYERQEVAMGQLCDLMESKLLNEKESYLAAYKKVIDQAADAILDKVRRTPGDPNFFEKELAALKRLEVPDLKEVDDQHERFIESWKRDLKEETTRILNAFSEEAKRIMVEGVLADDVTEHLDTDKSPKH